MADTPFQASFVQSGLAVDHTPAGIIAAGDLVVQADLVGIAKHGIAATKLGALAVSGVFDIRREAATAFAAGAEVYWDAAATSEGGSTGAAVDTSAAGVNPFIGYAVEAVTDVPANLTVRVLLRNDVSVALGAMVDVTDVGDGTPTAGDLLIGDGDSWEAEPVSGLVALALTGEVSLPTHAVKTLGLPLLIHAVYDETTPQHIFDAACPRAMQIIDAWVHIAVTGGAAATLQLHDGTNAISDAMDVEDTAENIVRVASLNDSYSVLAVNDSLELVTGGTQASMAGEIYILAIPLD